MSISFKGKVAIVTGGAMGIGEATAQCLSDLGAAVAIFDRDSTAGHRAVQALSSNGRSAEFYECDVAVPAQVEKGVNSAVKAFGAVDVLVCNAGIQRYGDTVDTTDPVWDEVMSVNVKGCLHARYAVPHMLDQARGAIVVVGSVQSFVAVANSVAYVTAKHALLGLVRAMALDYARDNIRVKLRLSWSD